VSSPPYPGKLILNTPPSFLPSSVPFTIEGLPSHSSAHFLISFRFVVVCDVCLLIAIISFVIQIKKIMPIGIFAASKWH